MPISQVRFIIRERRPVLPRDGPLSTSGLFYRPPKGHRYKKRSGKREVILVWCEFKLKEGRPAN
jgi:hypothetical protein